MVEYEGGGDASNVTGQVHPERQVYQRQDLGASEHVAENPGLRIYEGILKSVKSSVLSNVPTQTGVLLSVSHHHYSQNGEEKHLEETSVS